MDQARKEALSEQLDQQRKVLSSRYSGVKQGLDLGHQIKQSLKRHPGRWAAAGAGTGLLALRLLRRKKVIYQDLRKRRGLILRSGSLLFKLARPALTTVALKYARDYLETRLEHDPDNSMLGGPPQK